MCVTWDYVAYVCVENDALASCFALAWVQRVLSGEGSQEDVHVCVC